MKKSSVIIKKLVPKAQTPIPQEKKPIVPIEKTEEIKAEKEDKDEKEPIKKEITLSSSEAKDMAENDSQKKNFEAEVMKEFKPTENSEIIDQEMKIEKEPEFAQKPDEEMVDELNKPTITQPENNEKVSANPEISQRKRSKEIIPEEKGAKRIKISEDNEKEVSAESEIISETAKIVPEERNRSENEEKEIVENSEEAEGEDEGEYEEEEEEDEDEEMVSEEQTKEIKELNGKDVEMLGDEEEKKEIIEENSEKFKLSKVVTNLDSKPTEIESTQIINEVKKGEEIKKGEEMKKEEETKMVEKEVAILKQVDEISNKTVKTTEKNIQKEKDKPHPSTSIPEKSKIISKIPVQKQVKTP